MLSLVDEVLALSVEPMMKWLDMDIEASKEESVTSMWGEGGIRTSKH